MAITITLNNIRILKWTVNVYHQNVTVVYQILDSSDETYSEGEAIFWATMPESGGVGPDGQPRPIPDYWYLLPPEYVTALTNLTIDARTALLHLVNEQ